MRRCAARCGWLLLTLALLLGLGARPTHAGGLLINGDRSIAGRFNYCPATGSTNAYVCTITPAVGTYQDGMFFTFKANAANTGAATLNVNGLGAKALRKRIAGTPTALNANDIGVNQHVTVRYDASNDVFQADSLGTATAGTGTVTSVTGSGPIVLTPSPIVATGNVGFDSSLAGTLKDGGTTDLICGTSNQGKAQVMDSGEWQYCDGATTSVRHGGLPTQSGLTWNITAASCTGDTNGGKITVNGSNQLICTADQGGAGGSGDITDVGTCTTGACFTDASPSTQLTYSPIATPATPAAGKARVYVNSTSKNFSLIDDAGVVKHGVQTKAVVATQFLTGLTDAGLLSGAQPNFTDLAGSATNAQLPATISGKRIDLRYVALTDLATVTPNGDTTDVGYLATLSQDTLFANPTGTPTGGQKLQIIILSSAVRLLTWGTLYAGEMGLPLPVATSGGSTYDAFGFEWNTVSSKWAFVATSQSSLSARRRTCMITFGSDDGPALTDVQLGPQLKQCKIPSAATVEEISVTANAGTPSVVIHRRTGTTNTALLSTALATGAAGAETCARTSAVVGLTPGVTCSATLQNTTVAGGDWFGATSGTAGGVATSVEVAIHYVLTN